MTSPIDALIDRASLKCGNCGAPMGACDCWVECRCGWSFLKGTECRNPQHVINEMAKNAGEFVAQSVVLGMRDLYPEPMKHASGGFRKTLHARVKRETELMIASVLEEWEKARPEKQPETRSIMATGRLKLTR